MVAEVTSHADQPVKLSPTLLYDGTCGFCNWNVQFVLRHERESHLCFAALDSDYGNATLERHPEVKGVDSMVWLEPAWQGRPERVYVRSDAALRVISYLGGRWRLLLMLGKLVPKRVRDAIYDLVARHRHRILGREEQCFLPPSTVRHRFLD